MDIIINDVKINFTLDNEKTINDVLIAIENELEKNTATIFNIKVDGKEINVDKMDELKETTVENVQKVELRAIFAADIVFSFKDLIDPINELNIDLENVPVYIQGAEKSKIPEILTKFADIFDQLCHLVTLTALFPKEFENTKVNDKSLPEFLNDFAPLLKDFEGAIAENDTVLISDISEYEIKPRFEDLAKAIEEF